MTIPSYFSTGGAVSQVGQDNFDVPFPGTVSVDDCLILFATHRYIFDEPSAPWVKIADHDRAGLTYGGAWCLIADGTETGNLNITGLNTGAPLIARMVSFKDAVLFEAQAGIDGNSNPIDHPDIVTGGTDRLAITYQGALVRDTPPEEFIGETGGNLEILFADATSAGLNHSMAIQTAPMASAGTISGGTSDIGNAANWMCIGFALYGTGGEPPPVTPKFSGIILSGGF